MGCFRSASLTGGCRLRDQRSSTIERLCRAMLHGLVASGAFPSC
jgi:hypothetical protein